MNSSIEILFVDRVDCQHSVAEIQINGQRICQLNKERGVENIDILFLTDLYVMSEQVELIAPLDRFLQAIEVAKRQLIDA